MVEITELNREPASTVSTLTATTEVTSPSVIADALEAGVRLSIPSYATREDAPDEDGLYEIEDVDGTGRTGVIYREVS